MAPFIDRLDTPRARSVVLFTFLALCLAWTAWALSLVGVVSSSTRLAAIFFNDDGGNAAGVVHMLAHHTLDYGHTFYPGFYFNLTAIGAWLPFHLGASLPRAALLSTRILSALAGGATLVLTGLLARRLSGRNLAALLAAAFLATSPRFFNYAFVAHPDTLQTALMVASLLVLVGYVQLATRGRLLAASALAGLAAAAKYGGVFIVPFIAVATIVVALKREKADLRSAALEVARRGGLAALVFLLAFVAGHPRFLVHAHVYIQAIRAQGAWHAWGHLFKETKGPLTWVQVLASGTLLGPVTAGVFLLAPVVGVVAWIRRRGSTLPADRLFGYVATAGTGWLYLAFLLYGMRDFAPRFMFPCVPVAAAFSGALLVELASGLRRPVLRTVAVLAVAGWAVVWLSFRLPSLARVDVARRAVVRSPVLAVGRWLVSNVPLETPLLYDHYTWVPDELRNAVATWGIRPSEIARVRPTVIVTNSAIADRYADPTRAAECRLGPDVYLEIHREYADLAAGRLDGFRLVAKFAKLHTWVYARGALADRLAAAGAH